MKKTLTKILTLILAVITATAFVGCADNSQTAESDVRVYKGYVDLSNSVSNGIRLMSSEAQTVVTDTENYLMYDISATVYPVDAINKEVDWSVEWLTQITNAGDVSEYVTVEPDSDGSTEATIKIYKAFLGGKVSVICTTREGKKTATCTISYLGLPTEFNAIYDGNQLNNGAIVKSRIESDTVVNIELSNFFNVVGDYANLVEMKGYCFTGRFNVDAQYVINGSVKNSGTITLGQESDYTSFNLSFNAGPGNEGIAALDKTYTLDDFVNSITLVNGVLKVNLKQSEEAFSYGYSSNGVASRTGYNAKYASAFNSEVFGIKVTLSLLDQELDIIFDPFSTVTGVALSIDSFVI